MKRNQYVSDAVIKRLPRYSRILEDLIKKDIRVISSNDLSKLTGLTASQIRQDLNNFGAFGLSGYGYNVKNLLKQICMILGLNKNYKLIIIGAGHLGQAVVSFTRYLKSGFNIIAIFEVNPRLIGLRVNGIEVLDIKKLDKFLKENPIDIGIITTNRETAQPVADQLISGGVKGIWNFTTRDLITPTNMPVENLHLTDSLTSLAYHVNEKEKHYENK